MICLPDPDFSEMNFSACGREQQITDEHLGPIQYVTRDSDIVHKVR